MRWSPRGSISDDRELGDGIPSKNLSWWFIVPNLVVWSEMVRINKHTPQKIVPCLVLSLAVVTAIFQVDLS